MHSILIDRADFNKYKKQKYTNLLQRSSKIMPYRSQEKTAAFNPEIICVLSLSVPASLSKKLLKKSSLLLV